MCVGVSVWLTSLSYSHVKTKLPLAFRPRENGFFKLICFSALLQYESEVQVNLLTPNDPYRGRTAPLTSEVPFYTFIQQYRY